MVLAVRVWSRAAARLSLIAAAVSLGVAFLPNAHACVCTYSPPMEWEFEHSSIVFAGVVTNVQTLPDGIQVATFTPTMRWKGSLDNTVYVAAQWDCSPDFCAEEQCTDQTWIVFGQASTYRYNGQAAVGVNYGACGNTQWLAPEIIAALPPTELPVPTRASTWGRLKMLYR